MIKTWKLYWRDFGQKFLRWMVKKSIPNYMLYLRNPDFSENTGKPEVRFLKKQTFIHVSTHWASDIFEIRSIGWAISENIRRNWLALQHCAKKITPICLYSIFNTIVFGGSIFTMVRWLKGYSILGRSVMIHTIFMTFLAKE